MFHQWPKRHLRQDLRKDVQKITAGNLEREACPPKTPRRKGERDSTPAAAASRAATAAAAALPGPPEGDQEAKP
jgi:hypothetical protein